MMGRKPNAPVRIPVLDRYTDRRGVIATGKIESGTIHLGMKVVVMPARQEYKCDALWSEEENPLSTARPGENIHIKLNGASISDVQKGFVICSNPPCRSVPCETYQDFPSWAGLH